jgi:hypothetical protein
LDSIARAHNISLHKYYSEDFARYEDLYRRFDAEHKKSEKPIVMLLITFKIFKLQEREPERI